ncbi:MAG: hypothetical protein ACI9IP_000331 [Arcticibacterium sp.]|jgi:hypothetical protein
MKKVGLFLIVALLAACKQTTSENSSFTGTNTNAIIEFEENSFDFGSMTEGDKVSHTFKFKNVGTDPLEILSVNVSCGCTVASKPLGAVGVGQTDEIVINFNSAGKVGMNKKSVGVFSNAQNSNETLTFTAMVEAQKGAETDLK